jgi:hypothetical protein
VTDLNSTNGTFIEEEEIEAQVPNELPLGAEIIFGARCCIPQSSDPHIALLCSIPVGSLKERMHADSFSAGAFCAHARMSKASQQAICDNIHIRCYKEVSSVACRRHLPRQVLPGGAVINAAAVAGRHVAADADDERRRCLYRLPAYLRCRHVLLATVVL